MAAARQAFVDEIRVARATAFAGFATRARRVDRGYVAQPGSAASPRGAARSPSVDAPEIEIDLDIALETRALVLAAPTPSSSGPAATS